MQHLSTEELNQRAHRLGGLLEKHDTVAMTPRSSTSPKNGAATANGAAAANTNGSDDDRYTTSDGFYYLTNDAREKLPLYQYKGSDLSLLYKYVLSPLAEWCVQTFLPTSMAPNTVTAIGLVGMISSYGIYWWYVPTLAVTDSNDTLSNNPPPNWIFLYNAIAMLVYQTLDNMDGKQARRTKSSSPLGLLFDHGCDAVNSIFGSANWIIGMSLLPQQDQWQVWALVFGPFAMFYVATWEQYYTGQLIMPIINGPNEGLMGGVLLSLTSFWCGSQFWQQTGWYEMIVNIATTTLPGNGWIVSTLPSTPIRNCDFVILASSIGFLQEIVWKSIVVISKYQREAASQALLPFVTLAGCFWMIGCHQLDLLLENPRTSLHLSMFLFVEMSTELMLAHVTGQRFLPFKRWQLLPLIMLTLWTLLTGSTNANYNDTILLQQQSDLLTAYTWSMGTYLLMKCVLVIHEICAVLQIWCFDIVAPYRSRRPQKR